MRGALLLSLSFYCHCTVVGVKFLAGVGINCPLVSQVYACRKIFCSYQMAGDNRCTFLKLMSTCTALPHSYFSQLTMFHSNVQVGCVSTCAIAGY